MNNSDFDPLVNSYLSWAAYVELCREQLETRGEYPPSGPWREREARRAPDEVA